MLYDRPYVCPPALLRQADGQPPARTAVVAAGAALPMESARLATDAGLIEPVLVGDPTAIHAEADRLGWDIAGLRIVAADGEQACAAAGAALAGRGDVEVLMKGQLHTDTFMSAILNKSAGLRTGRRFTHIFHITVPDSDRVLFISDGAINIAPDIRTRIEITCNAVEVARGLGIARPKVALLSATEEINLAIPSSAAAAEIAEAVRGLDPDLDITGPLALDNAISPAAAQTKTIDHPVAGRADILILPEIVSGNILFKSLVYFAGACAAGLVVGAKVPVVLTSRADPPAARLASAAAAAVLSRAAIRP